MYSIQRFIRAWKEGCLGSAIARRMRQNKRRPVPIHHPDRSSPLVSSCPSSPRYMIPRMKSRGLSPSFLCSREAILSSISHLPSRAKNNIKRQTIHGSSSSSSSGSIGSSPAGKQPFIKADVHLTASFPGWVSPGCLSAIYLLVLPAVCLSNGLACQAARPIPSSLPLLPCASDRINRSYQQLPCTVVYVCHDSVHSHLENALLIAYPPMIKIVVWFTM